MGAQRHRRPMDCFPELNQNFFEYVSTSFLKFTGKHSLSPWHKPGIVKGTLCVSSVNRQQYWQVIIIVPILMFAFCNED